MSIRLEGFDQLKRQLNDLAERAERTDGEHKVKFSDLFTTEFMRRYTDFLTLDEMFAASGFTVESTDDFEKIPDDQWEIFIQKNTLFGSWREMNEKAAHEWAARQLGLGE